MKNSLTYKQRFYVIAGVFLLVVLLVYNIALKPTIELKTKCKEQEKAVKALSTAPQRIKMTAQKLGQIDGQFSILSMPGTTSRDLILEEISQYCNKHKISVYNFPESHVINNKLFTIETNSVVLKSNFKRLLKLINYLETKSNFGRIISVSFYTNENRKTKRKELYLELVIQNIKSDEKDS